MKNAKEFTSINDKMAEMSKAEASGFKCTFDHEVVAYKGKVKFILMADGWHTVGPYSLGQCEYIRKR